MSEKSSSPRNWRITAWLCSPLCGEPPALDAIMEWELARRMGLKKHKKLTRQTPLSEINRPPIPLVSSLIGGKSVYHVSDPIIAPPHAEWVEHVTKRFDTSQSLLVAPEYRKKLLVGSGPYKMQRRPLRVRLTDSVTWFARGYRKDVNKLLKKITALGHRRDIGYGRVWRWEYVEVEDDWSLFALWEGQQVLMKTLPLGQHMQGVKGYKRSYGGAWPPYWHPDNYTDIAVPV